ncbi:MAG: 4Fe-4S binding protein [Promethearchaeota archaeon]|nr:MAG: 4Fe-4S binding protein [Candidatus Lokiarchaeota archaeon]
MIIQTLGPNFNLGVALIMFLVWIGIIGAALYLTLSRKMNQKYAWILLALSVILGGILLGGIPNAVMPIQQVLMTITGNSPVMALIPMILILSLLLVSTLFIGRLFCGYACPLGAAQELLSKIKFKSNVKEQNKVEKLLKPPQKSALIVRWVFFAVAIVLTILWGIAVLQLINPFLGFQLFTNPQLPAILIPLISLIVVLVSSVFIYRPWCRFFCPFGAIASLTSRFSRYKYRRTEDCTECGLCEQICPTEEAFDDSSKGECYYCNRCVDVCPQDAIVLKKE